MDHVDLLKKAWRITLRHRALWLLGILWALAGGSGGAGQFINISSSAPGDDFGSMFPSWGQIQAVVGDYLGWILLGSCFLFLLVMVISVLRYVMQAGVYRVLYRLQVEGVAPTVKAGFREGWHRRTWRLFLQNLLVSALLLLVLLALFVLVALPLLLWLTDNDASHILGTIFAGGVGLAGVFTFVFLALIVSVLSRFWWRAAVIDDMGVITSMAYAWEIVKANLRDVAIVWLLMFGISILFTIMIFVLLVALVSLAAILAMAPAYLLYELTQSPVVALLWGLPVGAAIFLLPMIFVAGLYTIFQAAVWNELYLQLTHADLITES